MRLVAPSMFRDRDGNTDAMIVIAFGIATLAAIAIIGIVGGEFISMFKRTDHTFNASGVGTGIAAIIVALGPFLLAFAAYWASDAFNRTRFTSAVPKPPAIPAIPTAP